MVSALDNRLVAIFSDIIGLVPESYMVGGAVRDLQMGKAIGNDLDLAVQGNGSVIAEVMSRNHGVTFVPLDDSHGSGRIVLKGEVPLIVDIASFKGPDIFSDLRMRDFTINALAIRLGDFLIGNIGQVLDPTGGISDIDNRTIKTCMDRSYDDDPLRILRTFRFNASLGFKIDPNTLSSIPASLPGLSFIAPERIRDEFVTTLAADSSSEALTSMDEAGVLDALFPELTPMRGCGQNEFHHLDVWQHSLEAIKQLEFIIRERESRFGELSVALEEYLREEPVRDRPLCALIKLALLFHDSGKPVNRFVEPGGRVRFFGHEKVSREIFERASGRLRLAKREVSLVGDLIEGHMRPMIFTGQPVSDRAIRRMHRRFQKDVIGLLLLFLADLSATRGPARAPGSEQMAQAQVHRALEICLIEDNIEQKPLLNGRDLMQLFGMEPGPAMGKLLKRLKELQDLGDITSKAEAIEVARAMVEHT